MKALVISRPGLADVLQIQERPRPSISPSQVLIRVRAAGLNRADLIQREGRYPAPSGVPADVPGLEVSGTIEATGAEVARWKDGDAVCALLAGGGQAEYVAVEAGHCLPVPHGWSFIDAASLPEAVFTVWHNVFQRGALRTGENFLVHGGSSGIGQTALQLARARGAVAFATAGNESKCRACEEAGARRAINYKTEDFEAALKDLGMDVILDMVGGEYTAKNLRILRPEGRLVFINAMKGSKCEVNIQQIMSRRLTVTGSTLRSREDAFKAALAAEVEREVWPLIEAGKFQARVYKVFPLADAAGAHRLMETSEHIGKIVLEVSA
jgi:NADPH:quinone reductase